MVVLSMDKSADVIVKEISEIVDNGGYYWDLCDTISYFADKIDVENPQLSLSEYELILYKFNALVEIAFIVNANYKPFVESNDEFKKANPEFDVYKSHNKAIKSISGKLTEIENKFDEYADEFYNDNTGGVTNG